MDCNIPIMFNPNVNNVLGYTCWHSCHSIQSYLKCNWSMGDNN